MAKWHSSPFRTKLSELQCFCQDSYKAVHIIPAFVPVCVHLNLESWCQPGLSRGLESKLILTNERPSNISCLNCSDQSQGSESVKREIWRIDMETCTLYSGCKNPPLLLIIKGWDLLHAGSWLVISHMRGAQTWSTFIQFLCWKNPQTLNSFFKWGRIMKKRSAKWG